MIDTVLVTAAAVVATVLVPIAMLAAWGFTGGDGTPANPVAPVAGLVVFGSALAAWVGTLGLLQSPWGWVFGAVLVAGVVVWAMLLTAHQDDAARRRIVAGVVGVALLLPLVFGVMAESRPPSRLTLLIAATPLLAGLLGLASTPELRGGSDDDRRSVVLAAAPFVGLPALLAAVWVVG